MNQANQQPTPLTPQYTRELRYVVVKCSDAIKYLSHQERTALETIAARCQLGRIDSGKKLLETLVVESDWPEYGPTWKAIEKRMQPTPPTPAGAWTETRTPATDAVWRVTESKDWKESFAAMHDHAEALERELNLLRRQAEADRATIEELKGHHQRDEEMIVQRTDEVRLLKADLSNALDQWNRLIGEHHKTGEAVSELRAQLASADKDRERMDWLERDGHSIETDGMVQRVVAASSGETFLGDTLRTAIDAALQPSASLDHGARGNPDSKETK